MKKIISILVLIITVTQVYTSVNLEGAQIILEKYMDAPRKELFKVFHYVFEKQSKYDLNSEEGVRRYRIFKDNIKFIQVENQKGHEYTLGITPFADMTNEEYRNKVLVNPNIFKSQMESMFRYEREFLGGDLSYNPGEIRVNHQASFGPVRDQGSCGSCWAFATLGAIEGNYNIQYKQLYNFSPQQLVDCDNLDSGCNGGWPTYTFQWISNNPLVLEKDYPYKGIKGTCNTNITNNFKVATGEGASFCSFSTCTIDSWLELLKKGPLEVAVDAGATEFQLYKSGVMDPKTCGAMNHAVIAFGIESDASGDYILVRNSWSGGWGEQGNFKIRVNLTSKTCGITELGWLPSVIQATPPTPVDPVDPTPPTPPTPTPSKFVCPVFFTGCSGTGTKYDICDSKLSLADIKIEMNLLSFKKNSASSVAIFAEPNCNGEGITFTKDESCISNSQIPFANKIGRRAQSLAVNKESIKSGCVKVYDECCYNKGSQEICADIPDLNKFNFNDKTSSLRFGVGVKSVMVFLDTNYQGLAYSFTTDAGCLDFGILKLFNNSISSIKLIK